MVSFMSNSINIIEKIKSEFNKNGLKGIVLKTLNKTKYFLFYTTSSIWYELKLDDSVADFTPVLDVQIEFMVHDKSKLIMWLVEYNDKFPWIFFDKEIESALADKHIFMAIQYKKHIIGYIKIGVGPTYIRDFDRTVVFEPGTAFICDTFILPDYRGKGLALFSLNKVARYCMVQGFKRILCHIEKWNKPSMKTFSRAGFREIDSIRYTRIAFLSFYVRSKFKPFLNFDYYLLSQSTLTEKSAYKR